MLRCYLLDDEAEAVDALAAMLRIKFADQVEVIGKQTDVELALPEIEALQPDVLFLDVEMPGMHGLDVVKQFPNRRFRIIFTTAHERYALPALKAAATDYLLKPLSPQDVYDALQKCKPETMSAPVMSPTTTRITLHTANEMLLVSPADIIRVEGHNNYSEFHFTNRPKVLISKTLKEFEEMLSPFRFFRVHQSHLINLNHVNSVQAMDGDFVTLTQGHRVELSRRRKADFLEALKQG